MAALDEWDAEIDIGIDLVERQLSTHVGHRRNAVDLPKPDNASRCLMGGFLPVGFSHAIG
jgi:hypothetical protein